MKRKMRGPLGIFWLFIFLFVFWFSPAQGAGAKNVILLIGDGMGPQAVGLAIYYNRFMNGPEKPLNMERLMAAGNTGYCLTYQYGTVVTDSASAATALASGVKTRDAIIGKDHELKIIAVTVGDNPLHGFGSWDYVAGPYDSHEKAEADLKDE
jgi:hypothetical protein